MLKPNNFNKLIENIVSKFLKSHSMDMKVSITKIKKLVRIDEDVIILNPEEIIDLVNFNIYTERERIQNENSSQNITEISKLSDFMQSKTVEESFINEENEYTKEELKDYIFKLSNKLSFNVFERNENIIITFI